MKLTAELILQSAQFTNALKDRELDLRGYKIPVIENLGATLDQFDTINFSDNDIKKLEGFPLLKRLKCLLLNNNRVCLDGQVGGKLWKKINEWRHPETLIPYTLTTCLHIYTMSLIFRIGEGLETCIPNLETLVLTNNGMQDLTDLEPLKNIKSLRYLSLMRNPILNKPNYRLYVIHSLPQIRVLDFQRIKQREREAAARMFSGKKGEKLVNGAMKSKTNKFVPGAALVKPSAPAPAKPNPQRNNIAAIKAAIANAKSLEEVQKLEMMLKTGHVPDAQQPMTVDKT